MKEQPPKLEETWIPCDCVYKVIQDKRILGLKNVTYGCEMCKGSGKINKHILQVKNYGVK